MLEFRNLTKIYSSRQGGEEVTALKNISLKFPSHGMVFFLLGKSGSGKSTISNAYEGLNTPTSDEPIIGEKVAKEDFDSYRNTCNSNTYL